tara:strand:- start:284 stop:592 length:309 start_codon:yes stop_codon:yes gene_type:complete
MYMANVFLRTDEQRESEPCPHCDTMDGPDGCECREVACVKCGLKACIYAMSHPDKENEELWQDLSFEDKIQGFHCDGCDGSSDEEEPPETDSESEGSDYDYV